MFDEEMRQRGFVFLCGEPGVMPTLHCHREVELNIVARGEVVYHFGGRRVTLPAGQITVFWATLPHGLVRLAPETRYYCIHLPLARFLQWRVSSELTSRLMHGDLVQEQDAAQFGRDLALFEAWRSDLERATPDANYVVLLEMEARLRRLAWSVASDPSVAGPASTAARDQPVDRVEQMANFISEHYRDPITVVQIAGAAELHPKYAMSLFRTHCGMTLNEYLTQHRLSQAQRLLATTDTNVTDIAFAAGFGSVSQFYEVFTRLCRQSPKQFRGAQTGSASPAAAR